MIADELRLVLEGYMSGDDLKEEYKNEIINDIKEFFKERGIRYTRSIDEIYSSWGAEYWSFSIAWIENGMPYLSVYCMTT